MVFKSKQITPSSNPTS